MIIQLIKYQKAVSWFLFTLFYLSLVAPVFGRQHAQNYYSGYYNDSHSHKDNTGLIDNANNGFPIDQLGSTVSTTNKTKRKLHLNHPQIGGPNQPEMASFKSVGTDNMVDLFTGNFSYNIPLLDVGGYPVNIFYDGNVGMEQEASWVGFGWNINPGTVNRNMRGVPDDFDGTDTLIEQQQMKPKHIWNVNLGAELELIGIQGLNLGSPNLGVSLDNYLGPALSLSLKGGTGFSLAQVVGFPDKCPSISLGISDPLLSSRNGLTLSAGASLGTTGSEDALLSSLGVGLSTSYNSRNGIAALSLSDQTAFNNDFDFSRATNALDRYATTIKFAKPSYIPVLHMPVTNTNTIGEFQLGLGIFGVSATADAGVSESQQYIAAADVTQYKPLVGYLYYQDASNNPNAVMDFTRFNDGTVLPNTPVIAVPQYTYDVFSIQGEGTGGCIRAYRNDLGYVRDNTVYSKDNSLTLGADIGIPGHYGGSGEIIKTPTSISGWINGNKLHTAGSFTSADTSWENVYFRNPGENCVLNADEYNRIGGIDLVRYALGGQPSSPTIESKLQHFNNIDGTANGIFTNIATTAAPAQRNKRIQVVDFLTAQEAAIIGLDKTINSYDDQTILDSNNNLKYTAIPRVSGYRKGHHISQVNVTEPNGKRYVYGLPVYNIVQKDFTFSIEAPNNNVDTDKVSIDTSWMKTSSSLLNSNSPQDGYMEMTQTPAYAHSFLLTGLLSPDYVDVTGDGITDDDIGEAVKFNYTRVKDAGTPDGWAVHKWRTPLTSGAQANFNPGNRTETKDDKGIVSYGERESWYMHSIESKTMIAIFTLVNRNDGKGTVGSNGGVNTSDSSMKRLDRIDLYSKSDLKQNGLAKAKPIKTVHFCYSYSLCKGTPDNTNTDSLGGRLTLDSIYFTFNGQNRANKDKYVFSYLDSTGKGNPNYAFSASDRWGNYKPATMNHGGLKNRDFPYCIQDTTLKTTIDQNAGAWALKKILLPSGGQLQVNYESNDYAYVQKKHAADMMQVAGFGANSSTITNQLFDLSFGSLSEHNFVFIKVPSACTNARDVFQKYLQGTSQLSFKIAVQMPKGIEYLRSYATFANGNYGVYSGDPSGKTIWVQLDEIDGVGALSMSAVEYLREQLPGQAYTAYDNSGGSTLEQVGNMLLSMLQSLATAFANPVSSLRKDGKTLFVNTAQSFVRLTDPDGFKYGGGRRVKSISLKDNWQAMTGQYTSTYGQTYDYTTTEVLNGITRTISSGVASYEPAIGSEENPFDSSVQVADKLPLGPASFGSIEMPVLDAFFPSPSVGYSKVTVRSLNTNTDTTKRSRSGIGKQVTQYYTSKDYPTYVINTNFDPASDEEEHISSTSSFFGDNYAQDYKALSQGFLVINNDMNGRLRSQASYAENDDSTPINYTENFYRNTGANGMNDKFSFVNNAKGDSIAQGNMGVDIELMTDTREFSETMTDSKTEGQAELFPIFFPFWIPFVWKTGSHSDNVYRAVTTTKVVSYHAVLDSVVVIDKGSQSATKNLVYDAETGNVIVNRTNNEFNQPIYTTNYPAYWAYSGMGPAYKNIDAVYNNINFYNGAITNTALNKSIFESGDELYITNITGGTSGCVSASPNVSMLWAYDTSKNTSSLTNTTPHFIFIDSAGNPYTRNSVSFKIVRSGKRNMLDAQVAAITSLNSPVVGSGANLILSIDSTSKVINASASQYTDKWQADNSAFIRYSPDTSFLPNECPGPPVLDCNGSIFEQSINPYQKGLIGNFKPSRSLVFYGNRTETDPAAATNISQNGFINGFKSYWNFNTSDNLVPNTAGNNWVWNTTATKLNDHGLELETENALGIYTAAQYGYDKDLPVAITNNARSNESFYDGFEDQLYNPSLENGSTSACQSLINFTNGGKLINTDSMSFAAHTGKYALAIAHGATDSVIFPVVTNIADSFALVYNADTPTTYSIDYQNYGNAYNIQQGLSKLGTIIPIYGGINDFIIGPLNGYWEAFGNNFQSFDLGLRDSLFASGYRKSSTQINGSLVFEIDTPGIYKFDATAFYSVTRANGWPFDVYSNAANSVIADTMLTSLYNVANNQFITPLSRICQDPGGYSTDTNYITPSNTFVYTYCLPKGVYYIMNVLSGSYNDSVLVHNYHLSIPSDSVSFVGILTAEDPVLPLHFAADSAQCHSIATIAGNPTMINPNFDIPANKKMVFSGWVHEDCTDPRGSSCPDTTYTHSQVQLYFNGAANSSVTFAPAGPIIEGWQRYEGYFSVPAGDTGVTLKLLNQGTQNVYFDDIRFHPFNANMKSYVYDPVSLRLVGQLDENNYATFYEYDEEGTLVRTKAETIQGIKTINETRSAKQKTIVNLQ